MLWWKMEPMLVTSIITKFLSMNSVKTVPSYCTHRHSQSAASHGNRRDQMIWDKRECITRPNTRLRVGAVAFGWAGAVFKVTRAFAHKKWGKRTQKQKVNSNRDRPTGEWTGRRMEKAGCSIACMRLKSAAAINEKILLRGSFRNLHLWE